MYHELCASVVPTQSLAEVFRDWSEISENLAEPSRNRPRFIFR